MNLKYSPRLNFVSEYGGTWWYLREREVQGYGDRPASEQEFLDRYKALTEVQLNHPKSCASCYTQLYDVEQEATGLYTYDCKPKFDPEYFKKVNSQVAAIEK